jgi:REP element-mobilizing transposase RayT
VHLLLSLPATLSVSKAMQLLKGNPSKWLREELEVFLKKPGYDYKVEMSD